MQGKPGTFKNRFGSLYLDPQGDGGSYEFAKEDDYALRVNIPGTTTHELPRQRRGQRLCARPSRWCRRSGLAHRPPAPQSESVEWSVGLGRFKLGLCGRFFGIGVYHHWFSAVGDDYGWPSNQFFDQPGTWQLAKLQGVQPCAPPGQQPGQDRLYLPWQHRRRQQLLQPADRRGLHRRPDPAGQRAGDRLPPPGRRGELRPDHHRRRHRRPRPLGLPSRCPRSAPTRSRVSRAAGIPIMGLGEGGYAFFGKLNLFIGWPNGWHGPQEKTNKAAGAPADYYTGVVSQPGAGLQPAGQRRRHLPEPGAAAQRCHRRSAWRTPPRTTPRSSSRAAGCCGAIAATRNGMAADGKTVFLNAVAYMRVSTSAQTEPPPPVAVHASPRAPTRRMARRSCRARSSSTRSPTPTASRSRSSWSTPIPMDTIYVPGSASDGIAPGADGSLVWPIPASP